MKKTLLLILVFFCALSLYAVDPVVKFYLNDESQAKDYKIEDIDNIAITNKTDCYLMKIYCPNSLTSEFATRNINLFQFGINSSNNRILNIFTNDLINTYILSEIYSIYFVQRSFITRISPTSAYIGDIITVYGSGFGYSNSIVSFSGADVSDYQSCSDTEIKVKVPIGAATGKLFVTVNNQKSNEVDFTVSTTSTDAVIIGTQTWTCNNLDVDHYRNGDSIPEVKDGHRWANLTTGAWCYYNNDPALGAIYGKLYNWYAVNDPRGLARDGWHIPTYKEWTTLSAYLGGDSVSGGKLKSTGTTETKDGLWYSPNTDATNLTGFSALPGGFRSYYGSFDQIGHEGRWWSSNETNTTDAWDRFLYYDRSYLGGYYGYKENGFSVRCVKD